MKALPFLPFSLVGALFILTVAFTYESPTTESFPVYKEDGLKRVLYKPQKRQVSYLMTINGQSREVTYIIQGSRNNPGLSISVKRPGQSLLQIRQVNDNTKLGDAWDEISKEALGKHWLGHEVFGLGALQESQPQSSKMAGVIIGGVIDLLGKINFQRCRHTVNCTCPNGMTASASCPCRKGAGCVQSETEVIVQTPEGNTTTTEQSCMAVCR